MRKPCTSSSTSFCALFPAPERLSWTSRRRISPRSPARKRSSTGPIPIHLTTRRRTASRGAKRRRARPSSSICATRSHKLTTACMRHASCGDEPRYETFRGMGKGWAKGLTAATDPRIARAAAAHRGKIYERRTPIELCRWNLAGYTTLPLSWSDEMAYVVGLTATDGCLVTGRRAINFKSGDRALVETYLRLLGRKNRVKSHPTESGGGA